MKFYISGKISDTTREKEKENLARFNTKAAFLRKLDFEVFNPGEFEAVGWTWEQYLARDLKWIFDNSLRKRGSYRPIMYMLHGWEDSRGARLEYEVGKLLGLQFIYERSK